MAITSPFKKLTHSRESSKDESGSQSRKGSKSTPRASHSRNASVGVSKTSHKKSNTIGSIASQSSTASGSLAQQYESDKQKLIKYCFSKHDNDGTLVESYITHVRVIEDSMYPNTKPPGDSVQSNKKQRILSLAVKKDGAVFLHKGRENPNGSFQIGRTWNLGELTAIQREADSDTGFLAILGKSYYWETHTSKERQVFITSLVRIYRKFTNGYVPQLIGWDLAHFGLNEETYKAFLIKNSAPLKSSGASISSAPKSVENVQATQQSLSGSERRQLRNVDNTKIVNQQSLPTSRQGSLSTQQEILPQASQRPSHSKEHAATSAAQPLQQPGYYNSQPKFPTNQQFPKPMQPIQRVKTDSQEPVSRVPTQQAPQARSKASQAQNLVHQNSDLNMNRQSHPQRPQELPQQRSTNPTKSKPQNRQQGATDSSQLPSKVSYPSTGSHDYRTLSPPRRESQNMISPTLDNIASFPSGEASSAESPKRTPAQRRSSSNSFRQLSGVPAQRQSSTESGLLPPFDQSSQKKKHLKQQNEEEEDQSFNSQAMDTTISIGSLEREIKQQFKPLSVPSSNEVPRRKDLEQHVIPSRKDLDNLGIPVRKDVSEPLEIGTDVQTTTSSGSDLNLRKTTSSAHDIQIVAHRKSITQFTREEEEQRELQNSHKDDEDDDDYDEGDITGMYYDASDSTDLNDSAQASYDKSYDSKDQSQEHITVTPATIAADVQSDDEYDDLNEIPNDATPKVINKRSHRGNTISSAIDDFNDSNNNMSYDELFDDVFDEIDWETSDDSETLKTKLLKELSSTEYDTTKQLIEIQDKSNTFEKLRLNIEDECEKLIPILNFFSVELAGFAKDIRHIENESQGLQVETINKKNLWNDLQNLLNTISLDDRSLRILLSSDIDKDLTVVEEILSDLENAIIAIRGGDKFEEDLGDMKVLKERKATYENVINKFLSKLMNDLGMRFKSVVREIDSSADQETEIEGYLSHLMVYSGLILFARDVSEDKFYDFVSLWEASANPLYKKIILGLVTLIGSTSQEDKFSLASIDNSYKKKVAPLKRRPTESKHDRLRQRFGLKEENHEDQGSATGPQSPVLPILFSCFDKINNIAILQQNFLIKFFHMSSDDLDLSTFIQKYPQKVRPTLIDAAVDEIDYDRDNAKDILNSMTEIFQPNFDEFIKAIVTILRANQKNTPSVLLYIELFDQVFGASNQEFLLNAYKKLIDRLKIDWIRFVDNQVKIVEKSTIAHKKAREVSIVVQNFAVFVKEIEKGLNDIITDQSLSLSSKISEPININELTVREIVDSSYIELSRVILANLQREEDEKGLARLKIYDENEHKEKSNHTINLIQNSNYLIDTLSDLKVASLEPALGIAKEIFTTNRDLYVGGLVSSHLGKLVDFVVGVEGLINETRSRNIDPSKRNTYSKSTLSKILSNFDSHEIQKIIDELRKTIIKHYSDLELEKIQNQLIEKIWSALQTQFVSYALRLQSIADKYYKDVEIHFTKRDVIAAFNSARA